jgi:4-amino-4-deoxy-L-arabinose transferase-like glycosyltransferase
LDRLRALRDVRMVRAVVLLTGVLLAVVLVQLPVLGHYFFGDDFWPLADIASHSAPSYVRRLFLLQDPTPNWRFLPGLVYLGAYRAFGLNPAAFLMVGLLVHTATCGLIFWFVRRAAASEWPALLAAAFFGLTSAHSSTLGQVTALDNVLAGFFVMLALVCLFEALQGDVLRWWLLGSVAAFALAIASNDAAAAVAPVFAGLVLWKTAGAGEWWRDRRAWIRTALLSAPFAIIGATALASLGACRCTAAADMYAFGDNVPKNLWIFTGRLLYPVGTDYPGLGLAHQVAGPIVLAVAIAVLLRGPAPARLAVLFLGCALTPFLFIDWVVAPRHLYLAAIPFSILSALLIAQLAQVAGRWTPALPALLAALSIGVIGLYGWQTVEQNAVVSDATDNWRALVAALQDIDAETGDRVVVVGGPLTDEIWRDVLPSLSEVLWDGVSLETVAETPRPCSNAGRQTFVLRYDQGRYTPAAAAGGCSPR